MVVVAVTVLAVLAGFAAVAAGLVALALHVRRRGAGDVVFGIADEIWHPVRHDTRIETQLYQERGAPSSPAGDT